MWTKYKRISNKSGWSENVKNIYISARPEQAVIILKAEFPFSNFEFEIDNKNKKPVIHNSQIIKMLNDEISVVLDRKHVDELMEKISR